LIARVYGVVTTWGFLNIAATVNGVCGVSLGEPRTRFLRWLASKGYDVRPGADEVIAEAHKQLGEYFAGVRREFKLPLDLKGTPFQLKIWESVLKIPYGDLWPYRRVAEEAGHPKAYRAAGNAVGENPVTIIIPCHRVVRSDGTLGGYGGREHLKKKLLKLEGSIGRVKSSRRAGSRF
jgi:O-6-methylguanine DNA methyltransferase